MEVIRWFTVKCLVTSPHQILINQWMITNLIPSQSRTTELSYSWPDLETIIQHPRTVCDVRTISGEFSENVAVIKSLSLLDRLISCCAPP